MSLVGGYGGGADHIYFIWDGTDPRTSSTRSSYYAGFDRSGIAVFSSWETMTIKAYAVKEGYQDSDVTEFTYIVAENIKPEKEKLNLPTASIPSGTEVEAGTAVSLLSGVNGAVIYYTLDGTKPSQQSFLYSKPFIIEKDTVITAYVIKDGYEDSDPAVFTYTVKSQGDFGKGDVLDEDIPQGKVENIPKGLWMSAVPSQVYTGKAIKPQVRVYDHTTRLTEKKDYTVSYKNNVKANIVSGVNVPTITVTGRGNYTGKETETFVISPKRLSDIDIMADDITLQYNGKEQKPLPIVTWNGKKLAKNKDYTVSYPNEETDGVADPMAYIKSGTYTVLVNGMGNYTGEKTINLTITQSKPASAMTVAKITDRTYTVAQVRPVPVVKSGSVVLTEGGDYEVSYQNNIKVGTATAIFQGINGYSGVLKKTYKIAPYDIGKDAADLTAADQKIRIDLADSYMYVKGCFKGTREKTYRITPKEIGRLTMTAADRVRQR